MFIQLHSLEQNCFLQATKIGTPFMIYVIPTKILKDKNTHVFPSQYQDFEDVFEKENANMISQHQQHNYAIKLQ
jgi:hypothetical protein